MTDDHRSSGEIKRLPIARERERGRSGIPRMELRWILTFCLLPSWGRKGKCSVASLFLSPAEPNKGFLVIDCCFREGCTKVTYSIVGEQQANIDIVIAKITDAIFYSGAPHRGAIMTFLCGARAPYQRKP